MAQSRTEDFSELSRLCSLPQVFSSAAKPTGPILEDFRPVCDSLGWRLGQLYWDRRGSKAFVSDHVPFTINNDGDLSRRAAEILFANLCNIRCPEDSTRPIFILEVGIGIGLFARLFLDWFQALCTRSGKDFYDRLVYVAGDLNEKMLLDATRNGAFANHLGHYLLRIVDATDPQQCFASDVSLAGREGRVFDAIFLNYVLDCLPMGILELTEHGIRQLCVRTRLADTVDSLRFVGYDSVALARKASSNCNDDLDDISFIRHELVCEYDFLCVDLDRCPHVEFAADFARARGLTRVLLNHGAIDSIRRLGDLLDPHGFMLVNDYGNEVTEEIHGKNDHFYEQFAGSTAVGLNFAMLKAFFQSSDSLSWAEPNTGDTCIISKLIHRGMTSEGLLVFQSLFEKTNLAAPQKTLEVARQFASNKQFALAAPYYHEALIQCPNNWAILHETARFAAHCLNHPDVGLALISAALKLNPSGASALWNSLGDILMLLSRFEHGINAFYAALRINKDDAQARLNLANAYVMMGDFHSALSQIANGLAIDKSGSCREGFLQLQSELIGKIDRQHCEEQMALTSQLIKRIT